MHLDNFIQSAVLLLFITIFFVMIFRYLGLGSILGLILAGIVIGPHSPGLYFTEHVADIRNFAELGTVLLLFIIGLEMRFGRLWAMRHELFGLGSLQILLSGLFITGYLRLFNIPWNISILGGLTLALSSTAMVIQMLQERGEIANRHGQAAFAILLMQDIAVVPLLALIPLIAHNQTLNSSISLWEKIALVLGVGILLITLGRYLVPKILGYLAAQGNHDGFAMVVLLIVLFSAWAMYLVGLSMAMGAFIMGMLLSESRYNYQIEAQIEPYKGLLMSLFFVAVGMSIDPTPILNQPILFFSHITVISIIKLLVVTALGLLFGLNLTQALRLSTLLAQSGEFGFVLLGSANKLNLIDDTTFAMFIGIISVSMLITPLLVHIGAKIIQYIDHPDSTPSPVSPEITTKYAVILAGYGRVGHTVAVILHGTGIPFIAFDNNPDRVAKGQADGFPVYFGNVNDPALWIAAHAEQTSLVVITVKDGIKTIRLVEFIRENFPQLQIISRAHDLEACGKILQAGASYAFPEVIESSMRLGAQVLEILGTPTDNVNMLMAGARKNNYSLVRED
ncbi:portal protein [Achromatium sp. WMS2]|nr:portal protein [Achromatium sp. WMS2]